MSAVIVSISNNCIRLLVVFLKRIGLSFGISVKDTIKIIIEKKIDTQQIQAHTTDA